MRLSQISGIVPMAILRDGQFSTLGLLSHSADMMLVGKLINATGRLSIGSVKSRLSIGARRPDVGKGSPAAVGHPEARILPVPPLVPIGIGGAIVIVDLRRRASVTAQKPHVINHRVSPCAPDHSRCPWIHAAGEKPETT